MIHEKSPNIISFDNPVENRKMIETILEDLIHLDDLKPLLDAQRFIQQLLNAYVITSSTKATNNTLPKMPELHALVENHIKKGIMKLNDSELKKIQIMHDAIVEMMIIHKKVSRTKKSFQQKLTKEIQAKNKTIWRHMIEWVSNQLDDLVTEEKIGHPALFQLTKDWVTNSKNELTHALETAVKDTLHALVNKTIILAKINAANGWKNSISSHGVKDNPLIPAIEKEIKDDLKNITNHYDAPFIDAFSGELFTRCYKQLLAPAPKKEPTNTIKELIGDINLQLLKKEQWPEDIQALVDAELLVFLETMCNEPPNIHAYAKKKSQIFATIANHKKLTNKQKKSIQKTYFKLIRSSKKYQKVLNHCNEKIKMTSQDPSTLIRQLCQTLEMVHHEYLPFVTSLVQQYQHALQSKTDGDRKKIIDQYANQMQRKQSIRKTIELTRYIRRFFEKNQLTDPFKDSDWIMNYMKKMASTLQSACQPWSEKNWTDDLNHIIEILGIKVKPPTTQRSSETSHSAPSSVSEMITKPPMIEPEKIDSKLNNSA
jgi:hypothetical protein